MITKQQRIQLRSMATTIKPTVWVGKDGFDLQVYEQIKQELF
ncbi:MAG: YhbY family RNA-binding protein, partial [Clostridia bacterium]|nr:YhbY family RNA-binding protein [Clostridia bacterium]